jgi:OmpA-OmpF porin, OOP family
MSRPVEYVDDRGRVITGKDGKPVGDPVLYYDDYSRDNVGDFPRRWELIVGNFEVVDWQGARYVRVTSNGVVGIPLPRTLPERFTIEFAVSLQHGNGRASLATGPIDAAARRGKRYAGSRVDWLWSRAGITAVGDAGPEVLTPIDQTQYAERVVPVRVMADGRYMKVY